MYVISNNFMSVSKDFKHFLCIKFATLFDTTINGLKSQYIKIPINPIALSFYPIFLCIAYNHSY